MFVLKSKTQVYFSKIRPGHLCVVRVHQWIGACFFGKKDSHAEWARKTLGDKFKFPKHDEYLNDGYFGDQIHDEEFDDDTQFEKMFTQLNQGMKPQESGQSFTSMDDFEKEQYECEQYLKGLNDQQFMKLTKEATHRNRLNKRMFMDDHFKKSKIEREYGNYKKYQATSVETQKLDNGIDDAGENRILPNLQKVLSRINARNSKDMKQQEAELKYMDKTLSDDPNYQKKMEYTQEEVMEESLSELVFRERLKNSFNPYKSNAFFVGRLSPFAKEDIYRMYLKGWSVKDLSLKFGIMPERVKAIVWMKQHYWEEIYPKIGETGLRLGMEMELDYGSRFPFVDYGLDLNQMGVKDRGYTTTRIRRSFKDRQNIDKRIKEYKALGKERSSKKYDLVPIKFVGNGCKGYLYKSQLCRRGRGAIKVNQTFRHILQYCESCPNKIPYKAQKKMKQYGPRVAAAGFNKL